MKWIERFFAWLSQVFTIPPDHPQPDPVPEPQPIAQDAVPPQFVIWDDGQGEDIGAWPITVAMEGVEIKGGRIYWSQTGNEWPSVKKPGWKKHSCGNIWVLGKIKGKWHAATWDWIAPGARIKQLPKFEEQNDIHGPLEGWFPIPGDEVGFMVSAFARDRLRTVRERSQIVLVRVP